MTGLVTTAQDLVVSAIDLKPSGKFSHSEPLICAALKSVC